MTLSNGKSYQTNVFQGVTNLLFKAHQQIQFSELK